MKAWHQTCRYWSIADLVYIFDQQLWFFNIGGRSKRANHFLIASKLRGACFPYALTFSAQRGSASFGAWSFWNKRNRSALSESASLVKNSLPLFFSFLLRYLTLSTQLARNDTYFARLFSAWCIALLCLLPVLFSWDYFTEVWCIHGSLDLRWLCPLLFYRSRWLTVDVPLIETDFWRSRSSWCCWTWSSVQTILHFLSRG